MNEISKGLIVFGMILIVAGVLFAAAGKIPGLGRLPGDVFIKRGNFVFYFPLATSLLASLLLTLVLALLRRK